MTEIDPNIEIVEKEAENALLEVQRAYEFVMSEIVFEGHTIGEWIEYFDIEIPYDGNIIIYRELLVQAGRLMQEAYNYVTNINMVVEKTQADTNSLIREEKNRLIATAIAGSRTMSATKAETLAKETYANYLRRESMAAVTKIFWMKTLEKVKSQVDILKSLLMSEMARMKDDKNGAAYHASYSE